MANVVFKQIKELLTATDKPDVLMLDVSLMMRLLEWARESADSDESMHFALERLTNLSAEGRTLTMVDYEEIVGK